MGGGGRKNYGEFVGLFTRVAKPATERTAAAAARTIADAATRKNIKTGTIQ